MDVATLLPVILVTLGAFLLAVGAMAIGTIFSGRCLRGSCGGPEVHAPDGTPLSCATCPNRARHGK